MKYPVLKIRAKGPQAMLTTVELDGEPVPATRVQFDTGEHVYGLIKVTMTFYAGLDVEVEDVPAAVTELEPVA